MKSIRQFAILVTLCAIGCQLIGSNIVESPLSYSEQKQEIIELVPIGTSRDEAIRLTKAAGIDGTFGVAQTIYYCDLWNRSDGSRWHIDLALLFDDEGNLYQVRPGGSATGILPVSSSPQANAPNSASVPPTEPENSTTENSNESRRNAERTPFGTSSTRSR